MIWRRAAYILAVPISLLAAVILTGCGGGGSGASGIDSNAPRAWTVLVYMAADNTLEGYGIDDINEMESVGSTHQAAVLVQIDRREGGDASNDDWTTTRRYRITRDSDDQEIKSELLADLGELNMASPATLTDFVLWGVQNYPAQHYLLVLWDHGDGWQSRTLSAEPREVRAIHVDQASGMDDMSLPEIEQAFAGLPRMDIILFDACLMGMLEVAHSISNSADIMIASEEEVPANGAPYQTLIGRLAGNPGIAPATMASFVVNDYIDCYAESGQACTMSAISLSGLSELVSAAGNLAAQVTANLASCGPSVRKAAEESQHYDTDSLRYSIYSDYRDLYSFASGVRDSVTNAQVKAAASGVMSAVEAVVIAQRNTGGAVAGSRGISIYLPTPASRSADLLARYAAISFSRDTAWDEFIADY